MLLRFRERCWKLGGLCWIFGAAGVRGGSAGTWGLYALRGFALSLILNVNLAAVALSPFRAVHAALGAAIRAAVAMSPFAVRGAADQVQCMQRCTAAVCTPASSASCSQAVLHAARRVSRADSCPQLAVLSCTDPPVCTAPSGTAGQPCTACCSRLLLQRAELRERAPRGVLSVISSFFCLHVQITRRQHVTAWCCSSAASLPPLAVSPQHSAPIQLHQHRVLSHRCSALPPCVCLHCSTAAALLWLLWSLQGLQQCSAVQ